jgi:hypothetical protein
VIKRSASLKSKDELYGSQSEEHEADKAKFLEDFGDVPLAGDFDRAIWDVNEQQQECNSPTARNVNIEAY